MDWRNVQWLKTDHQHEISWWHHIISNQWKISSQTAKDSIEEECWEAELLFNNARTAIIIIERHNDNEAEIRKMKNAHVVSLFLYLDFLITNTGGWAEWIKRRSYCESLDDWHSKRMQNSLHKQKWWERKVASFSRII